LLQESSLDIAERGHYFLSIRAIIGIERHKVADEEHGSVDEIRNGDEQDAFQQVISQFSKLVVTQDDKD